MNQRLVGLALAGLLLLPAAAEAQRGRPAQNVAANLWSLEPYAGAFRDVYDISGDQVGYLLGARVGYTVAPRLTLHANLGYNRTSDIAFSPVPTSAVYDDVWVFTTAGAEFDVVPGRTSASVGAHAGVGWRNTVAVDDANPGPAASDGFAAYEVITPGITFRHRIANRAALTFRFEDYMFNVLEGPTDHGLALTLGLSFR